MNANVKENIRNILIENGVKCDNFDLAFKEFMKYFGVGVIDEKEERILKKVQGYTDIKSVPKQVIDMPDLIPSIRGRVDGVLQDLGVKINGVYDSVIKELESSFLSTMMNDIVYGATHQPLFSGYRDAVNIKKLDRARFKNQFALNRKVIDDNNGLIKKTITNIICATDGTSILSEAGGFKINIEKFCSICNVCFMDINTSTKVSETGERIEETICEKPIVSNDNVLLLLTRTTDYFLNENGYNPELQRFEIIIVDRK